MAANKANRRNARGCDRATRWTERVTKRSLPAQLIDFIGKKLFFIFHVRAAGISKRVFSNLESHQSSPFFSSSSSSSSSFFLSSSSSSLVACLQVVGGTKLPEIARVVLWSADGAILYWMHWVFKGEYMRSMRALFLQSAITRMQISSSFRCFFYFPCFSYCIYRFRCCTATKEHCFFM